MPTTDTESETTSASDPASASASASASAGVHTSDAWKTESNLYVLLGVPKDASVAKIRKAYYRLALKCVCVRVYVWVGVWVGVGGVGGVGDVFHR